MKHDHPHGTLAPVMLVSNAKLIATALFEYCDGFFGTAMKAKGIVVKGTAFSSRMTTDSVIVTAVASAARIGKLRS